MTRRLLELSIAALVASGVHAQSGDVVITTDTMWPEGTYTLDSLTVQNGATLTIGGGSTVNVAGAAVVTGNSTILVGSKFTGQGVGGAIAAQTLRVDGGSRISADGQGYGGGGGPGGGGYQVGVGGTYGGSGSFNTQPTYGSYLAPTDLGSAGSFGSGAGGGAIRLIVSGTLTNHGLISANGTLWSAGGSLYVTADTIAGSGFFTADGDTTGGGGGRIAIYYTTDGGFDWLHVTASAGLTPTSPEIGAGATPGTVHLLENGTHLHVPRALSLPVDTQASYGTITVYNGATFTLGGGSHLAAGTLHVSGNSTILVASKNNTYAVNGTWQGAGGTITAQTLKVDAGSRISADAQGYGNFVGPGFGGSATGGTYGGSGSNNTRPVYGSSLTPTDLGSGADVLRCIHCFYYGPGGGGGAIRLVVSGVLTNNGEITANGASGFNGGGSGGSLFVTAATITGGGVFRAGGGAGLGPTGGGGRIAMYYATFSFNPASITASAGGTYATAGTVVLAVDSDVDSLPDAWEAQFGLNASSAVGDDGSGGDPDHDGRTNLEEYGARMHPRGFFARHLAEGATIAPFDTSLALLNPGTSPALVNLRFLRSNGPPVSAVLSIPARTRRTVHINEVAGLDAAEFSTVIESDVAVIADRTMSWDAANGYGAHAETSAAAPALTWYLAEGATHSAFNLFYLLQNPNTATAEVRVRYLRPSGAPLEKTYQLPPNSRTNIWVDVEDFNGQQPLAATDVSAVLQVLNGQPIIVERAMYLDVPGQPFGAGHDSAGVTSPALTWLLAEGATGPYFDLFVLIANPGSTDAQVEATYLLPDGSTVVKPYRVAANSRFNIWVDLEDPRLANTAVSTIIRSTNNVPVVVERSMWWPDGGWFEAHNSPGATAAATRWALAEGEVGGSRDVETYVLIANTSAAPGLVNVTLLFEDGTSSERTFDVAGNSRFNVDVRTEFPGAVGKRFGTVVESLGAAPVPIVVERAMYWDAMGVHWAAGTDALATRLP